MSYLSDVIEDMWSVVTLTGVDNMADNLQSIP